MAGLRSFKAWRRRVRKRLRYKHVFSSERYRYSRSYVALLAYARAHELRNGDGHFLEISPWVGEGTRKLGAYLARSKTKRLYLLEPLLTSDIDAGNIVIASREQIDGLSFGLVSMHYDPGNDDLARDLQWAFGLVTDDGSIAVHNTDNDQTRGILGKLSGDNAANEVFEQDATLVLKKTRKPA